MVLSLAAPLLSNIHEQLATFARTEAHNVWKPYQKHLYIELYLCAFYKILTNFPIQIQKGIVQRKV